MGGWALVLRLKVPLSSSVLTSPQRLTQLAPWQV